jgi:hypothetical protein
MGSNGAAGTEQRGATSTSDAQMQMDSFSLVEEQTKEEPCTGGEVADQMLMSSYRVHVMWTLWRWRCAASSGSAAWRGRC